MTVLAHSLDRTVVIRAVPETVFRFFTDDRRWAAWWGAGSTIEPRPGGRVFIRYPNGVEASGEVVEIASPQRLVFTFGFASGKPMPPGTSRVTIELDPHDEGTELRLTHQFAEAAARDLHVQGWRYQLSVFSNIVSDEVQAGAAAAVDQWFGAWAMADAGDRERALAPIVAPDVRFCDRFSATDGLSDLIPHIGAALQFMPDIRLQRDGEVRHCQGVVLADWVAQTSDGQPRNRGTNVFVFAADGRIHSVTGFWN